MVFWLLFSNESIQNILILSATVAPFASAGIRPVVNRLNQDTTVYYGLVFCYFSWPYMVKWHNSGIIILIIGFFKIYSEIFSRYDNLEVDWLLLAQLECNTIQSHCEYLMTYSSLRKYSWNVPRGWRGRGEGVLPTMAYTGRLRPKGIPYLGFMYIRG